MSENYKNVTKEWLKNAIPNSHKVKGAKYFEDKEGNKYYVDGKNIILDYSEKEKEVAYWLKNTFGGEIYMLPKIHFPKGVKTADYLWNKEVWDLKMIKGNGKRVVDSLLKRSKEQSDNFIVDITNCSLSIEEILNQIERIYNMENRKWIDKIIVKKRNYLIKIYKRK